MDSKYTIEELTDLYIADALAVDDKAAFEKRMQEDENLAKEVMLALHIANAVERKGEQGALAGLSSVSSAVELKKILGNAERKHHTNRRKTLRIWVAGVSAAAIVSIVLIFGFQPSYSTQELFEISYVTPVFEPVVSRGGAEINPELQQILDSAGDLYEAGDIQAAAAEYDKAAQSFQLHEFSDDARFYRAVALAETGRMAEALDGFTALASDNDSEYAEDAQWQAALLYLYAGERDKAESALVAIYDIGGFYAAQAGELLDMLKQKRFFLK